MKIVSVRPDELGEPELARWRSIQAAHPAQDNPYLSPEFTLGVGAFQPGVRVAVISDGAEIVGFFPYQRHAFGVARPVGAGFRDCDGIVLTKGVRLNVGELLRACDLAVWQFDHHIPDQLVATSTRAERFASPVIDLAAGYEAYIDRLRQRSSSTLKGINYKRRRLEREVGEVRHVMHSLDPDVLRTFMKWKSAQYLRTGKADLFARPGFAELLNRLQHVQSESFCGSLSALYAGERMVAAHFGMHTPTTLVLWFPAYDTSFAKYSPGFIQLLALSADAANLGVGTFDLGRGRYDYKDQFKTGHFHVCEGWMARPSMGALVHRVTAAPRQEIVNFVRARPEIRARVVATRGAFRAARARSNLMFGPRTSKVQK